MGICKYRCSDCGWSEYRDEDCPKKLYERCPLCGDTMKREDGTYIK